MLAKFRATWVTLVIGVLLLLLVRFSEIEIFEALITLLSKYEAYQLGDVVLISFFTLISLIIDLLVLHVGQKKKIANQEALIAKLQAAEERRLTSIDQGDSAPGNAFVGSKTDRVRLAVFEKQGTFAISEIIRECPGVSRDMVRVVLRQMKEEGVLQQTGRGRASKWTLIEVPETTDAQS